MGHGPDCQSQESNTLGCKCARGGIAGRPAGGGDLTLDPPAAGRGRPGVGVGKGVCADQAVDALAHSPQATVEHACVLAVHRASAAGTERSVCTAGAPRAHFGRLPAPCYAAWRGLRGACPLRRLTVAVCVQFARMAWKNAVRFRVFEGGRALATSNFSEFRDDSRSVVSFGFVW